MDCWLDMKQAAAYTGIKKLASNWKRLGVPMFPVGIGRVKPMLRTTRADLDRWLHESGRLRRAS